MNRLRLGMLSANMLLSFGFLMPPAHAQVQPPPAPQAKAQSGPKYQVVPYSHNSAIMIELSTGKTWRLTKDPAEKGAVVWLPIRKLESDMEIDEWKQRSEKAKAEKKAKRMAQFEEAIPLEVEPFGFDEIDLPDVEVAPDTP